MDYDSYREQFFVHPAPSPRFAFVGLRDVAQFYGDYDGAVNFYSNVLGPPAYVEGDDTRGWELGDSWLTLLRGKAGAPTNSEIIIRMQSVEEANRLHAAFLAAGATGEPPSDQLMYRPVRFCPVTDPFGGGLVLIAPLPE